MKKILKINEIRVDEKLYPRERVEKNRVEEYSKAMKDGDIFPDIQIALFKGQYLLVDGRHRLEAYRENGHEYLQTDVISNYPNKRQIYLAAVKANLHHGQRLNERDKVKIAMTMEEMKFDSLDISKLLHIDLKKMDTAIHGKINRITFGKKVEEGKIKRVIEEEQTEQGEKREIMTKTEEEISTLDFFLAFITASDFGYNKKEIRERLTAINKIINELIK